jgi:AbrB family looped-hinge helix DNA binding protein
VIPKEARAALGVKAGDKLLVIVRNEQVIVLQKPSPIKRLFVVWRRGSIQRAISKRTAKLGLEALRGFLQRHAVSLFDTSIFIYELEACRKEDVSISSWRTRLRVPHRLSRRCEVSR